MSATSYTFDGSTVTLITDKPKRYDLVRYRVEVDGIERGVIYMSVAGEWQAETTPWGSALWSMGPKESVSGLDADASCERLARSFAEWTRKGLAPSESEYRQKLLERRSTRDKAAQQDRDMLAGLRSIRERLAGQLTDIEARALDRAIGKLEAKRKANNGKIGGWLK